MSYFPDLAIGVIGSPIPAYAELSGGSDGTNLQALLTDVNGQLKVLVQNFPATQAVTQSTTPWVDNITKWNGTALGNPSNWGDTAPTGNVIGVNAAIFSGNQPIGSTGDALRVSVSNFPGIFVVRGSLTQNNAAPSASTNVGVLPAVANAAAPTYIEGNQVLLSTDLTGALRVNVSAITAATVNQGNQGTAAQGWFVELTDGTNVLGTSSHPLRIDPTGTTTQPVSLTSTTITGTVAVTQSTSPWTIQGDSASGASKAGNPVQTGGVFNTTQPTVTTGQTVESQATARGAQIVATGVDTFNVTINTALPAGTNVIGHVITDSGSTTVVTGTVAVTQSTSPWVVSLSSTTITGNVSVVGTDADNATNSTTKLPVIAGRANASAPSWTEGHEVPLSTDLSGNLRITGAVTQSTSPWIVAGAAASGAAKSGNPVQIGGVFNTTQPTVTTGQAVEVQATARGAQIVATGVDPFTVAVNGVVGVVGTVSNNTSPVIALSSLQVLPALANAAAPSWTEGRSVVLSTDLSGNTRVILNAETTKVIGTVNQGTSPWVVSNGGTFAVQASGTLTNNNAAPSTNNLGVLPALANAAHPTYTEGDQVLLSTDLTGALRVSSSGSTSGSLTNNNAAPSNNNVGALPAIANAAAPSWTEGNQVLESVDLAGNQRVVLKAETTKVIGTVNQGTSPWVENISQWAGSTLGAPQNFGVNPGAVLVGSVNASIFAGSSALTASTGGYLNTALANVAGVNLGTTAVVNFGSAPAASAVPGVNASLFSGTTGLTNTSGALNVNISNTSVPVNPVQTTTGNGPTFTTVGVASATAVASNASRKGLLLVNTSANTISLGLNGNAAVLNSGITLYPGGSFEMDDLCFSTGAVTAIASAASSNLAIQEMQ